MQKLNLKKTTKDKLYAMLCEEQEKRAEAENVIAKQTEHAHNLTESYLRLEEESRETICELSAKVKKLTDENDGLYKSNVALNAKVDEQYDIIADRTRDVTYYKGEVENLKKIIYDHDAHPWKHLWRCIR